MPLTLTPLIPGTLGLAAAAGTSLTAAHLSPGSLAATAATQPPTGINVLYSNTYGVAYSFGNTPISFGFSGNGTPPEAFAPFVIYQRYGDYTHGTGTDVTKTTQAGFVYANYFGPPVDDASECFSTYVSLKDLTSIGGTAFTSSKPHTSFEAIATVEGGNSVTGGTGRVGVSCARFQNGTGQVDSAAMFYIGQQLNSGTIGDWYGLLQNSSPPGTVTNKWGAYLIDTMQTESRIRVAKSGNGMNFDVDIGSVTAFVYAKNPDGVNTLPTVRLDALSGQTSALLEFHGPSGGTVASVSRLGSFISQGPGFIANNTSGVSQMKMDQNGLTWIVAGLEQTTVGAAGGASALPATPTKYLKVVDSAGTTLVIPAYAA